MSERIEPFTDVWLEEPPSNEAKVELELGAEVVLVVGFLFSAGAALSTGIELTGTSVLSETIFSSLLEFTASLFIEVVSGVAETNVSFCEAGFFVRYQIPPASRITINRIKVNLLLLFGSSVASALLSVTGISFFDKLNFDFFSSSPLLV